RRRSAAARPASSSTSTAPATRSAGTSTAISPSIWAAASTAASTWVRTPRSRTRAGSAMTWSRRCVRCRSRTCAGPAAASPTTTTGDGIGPREDRPRVVNSHWGDVVEDNSFGTHEFMDLVELLGTEAYVNGNVGSGTVVEMSEWIEYLTRADDSPMAALRRANGRDEPWKVPYFGIGNESWGCGGNM